MKEYFNTGKIKYEGAKSKNPFSFRHYNPDEIIDAKPRRVSMTDEDIFLSYIAEMDSFALGFKLAHKILEDGRTDEFMKKRYSSFESGIGKKIVNGETTLAELSDYALGLNVVEDKNSGRQEYLESVINDIMFGGTI